MFQVFKLLQVPIASSFLLLSSILLHKCSTVCPSILNCFQFRVSPHIWQSSYTEFGTLLLWFFPFWDFLPLSPAGLPYSMAAVGVLNSVLRFLKPVKIANKPTGACPQAKHQTPKAIPFKKPLQSSFYLFLFALQCPHKCFHVPSRNYSHYLWEDSPNRSHYSIFWIITATYS